MYMPHPCLHCSRDLGLAKFDQKYLGSSFQPRTSSASIIWQGRVFTLLMFWVFLKDMIVSHVVHNTEYFLFQHFRVVYDIIFKQRKINEKHSPIELLNEYHNMLFIDWDHFSKSKNESYKNVFFKVALHVPLQLFSLLAANTSLLMAWKNSVLGK